MKATDFVVSADFRMFRVSWQDDINSYHVNLTNDRVVKGRGWGNNAERPALYRHNKVTGDIAVLDFQAKSILFFGILSIASQM